MEGFSNRKPRNPHESSPLPGGAAQFAGFLKKDGLNLGVRQKFRTADDGLREPASLVELKEKVHPEGQRFFSMILKGILPVADIDKVTLQRRFLKPREMHVSRVQNIADADSVDAHELSAIFIILQSIFLETDRGMTALIDHNIATQRDPDNPDRHKISIYDLEDMVIYFMDQRANMRDDKFFTAKWTRNYRMNWIPLPGIRKYEAKEMDPQTAEIVQQKLQELARRCGGDEGLRFICAIVTKLGVPLNEAIHFPPEITSKFSPEIEHYYEKAFQGAMMERVEKSLRALKEAREAKQ